MVLLLIGPGVAIFMMEGHLVQLVTGAHWLTLTILKNKWMDISESTMGIIAAIGTTLFLGLFFWLRRWWVVALTGVYVVAQFLILLALFSLIPRQT